MSTKVIAVYLKGIKLTTNFIATPEKYMQQQFYCKGQPSLSVRVIRVSKLHPLGTKDDFAKFNLQLVLVDTFLWGAKEWTQQSREQ